MRTQPNQKSILQRQHSILHCCFAFCLTVTAAIAQPIAWQEGFADDPLAAGRFEIPTGHDPARFDYDAAGPALVVHYDSFEPTAWYLRAVDPDGGAALSDCDHFSFTVEFRVRAEGFFADPDGFAQIGWGLVNTQTTGDDRAGGSAGPYAYDTVLFDYFPNVSPQFGGPTLGPTVLNSDTGEGFFSSFHFSFGAETSIDHNLGDESIALDEFHAASVSYDAASRRAVMRIMRGGAPLAINADGSAPAAGQPFDGDAETIETFLPAGRSFTVDAFALIAWQDTFNPFSSTVVADVEIIRIEFSASKTTPGDVNLDGRVDGRDITDFTALLIEESTIDDCAAARADIDGDGVVAPADLPGFVSLLVGT